MKTSISLLTSLTLIQSGNKSGIKKCSLLKISELLCYELFYTERFVAKFAYGAR